jgi:hypothetical protein
MSDQQINLAPHIARPPEDPAPHEMAAVEMVDGKWLLKNRGEGDRAALRSPEEEASAIEERRLGQYPWGTMSVTSRATKAASDLARRAKKNPEDGDIYALLDLAGLVIRALNRCPDARKYMRGSEEWPSLVPGGPVGGPLWKGWAKEFPSLEIGADLRALPRAGNFSIKRGTSGKLALSLFRYLDELRVSGPSVLLEELYTSGELEREPAHQSAARSLPELRSDSVTQWRDLALEALAYTEQDWTQILAKCLPQRSQSAITRTQIKADKGSKYGTGTYSTIDEAAAKNVVSLALLEGFRALVKGAMK